jgi:hypothetical protein
MVFWGPPLMFPATIYCDNDRVNIYPWQRVAASANY